MDIYNGEDLRDIGCYRYDSKLSHCFGVSGLNAKVAALMFDRVYMDSYDYISIRRAVIAELDEKTSLHTNLDMDEVIRELIPPEMVFLSDRLTSVASINLYDGRGRFAASKEEVKRFYLETFIESAIREGLQLTPLFSNTESSPETDDIDGFKAWSVIIERLPLVSADSASWEQVNEFRNDKHRLAKLRGIRRLHQRIAEASTEQQAIDILETSIEQYKVASEHHGFSLRKGVLEVILDKQAMINSAVVGAFTGKISAAIMAGMVSVVGNSLLKIKESKINKKQILLNGDGEAALIYDIGKKFSGNKKA